ncbi:MAG: LysR family transcriptional regulator [Desulfovibrionaceae bacterium]|nr:LysR family transcriptional regulator [Desulfovibrionaceae bacterium]
MELRVLRYFLAVAQEETISGAAQRLYVTQPTLSRQMMDLEEELGKKLFVRGKRKIALTEEGKFLRTRAQEIVSLADRTRAEFRMPDENISGEVSIGGGETEAMRLVARTAARLQERYPHISYHLFSGNADDVAERLDKGLVDFGLVIGAVDLSRYTFIELPARDSWGVLMRKDSPLAAKSAVSPGDLEGLPVLCSRQSHNELAGWMGAARKPLNLVATYTLLYNASLMVEEGLGYALGLDGIIRSSEDSPLCFRPLEPRLDVGISLVWKKYQIFSKAAEKFLEYLRREIDE